MIDVIGRATATFVATNIDDIVLLALFFGRATADRRAESRVVAGQVAGFGAIVAVCVVAALELRLLPESIVAHFGLVPLGLVPLALGIHAAVLARRARRGSADDEIPPPALLTVGGVAAVTFANGGDNVGVYIPVLSAATGGELVVHVVVFAVLLAAWCVTGRAVAVWRSSSRAERSACETDPRSGAQVEAVQVRVPGDEAEPPVEAVRRLPRRPAGEVDALGAAPARLGERRLVQRCAHAVTTHLVGDDDVFDPRLQPGGDPVRGERQRPHDAAVDAGDEQCRARIGDDLGQLGGGRRG
jgi:cadmium resistance protein CadD (predicted permease)